MDFTLDELASELLDLATATHERELPLERVASDEFQEAGYSVSAWRALADAGLLEAFLPEQWGGANADLTAAAALVRVSAAHGSMVPTLSVLAMGLCPILAASNRDEHVQLVKDVAAGNKFVTAAIREPGGRWISDSTTTAAEDSDDPDGYVINGAKSFVLFGREADAILVPARTEKGRVEVFVVSGDAPGLTRSEHPVSSHVPAERLTLTHVRVPSSARLTGDVAPATYLEWSSHLGLVAAAAGTLETALSLTASHVGSRRQFGRLLAQFQAVAMQVADAYIATATIRNVADAASWQLSTGRFDAARDTLAAATYLISHDLEPALLSCQHVHGGTAMDLDYPMHRFLTTGLDIAALLGGRDACLDASADIAVRS